MDNTIVYLFFGVAGCGLLLSLLGFIKGAAGEIITVTLVTLMGVGLVAAGVLIFQQPPWDAFEGDGEIRGRNIWQTVAGHVLVAGSKLGPQGSGAIVGAIGLLFFYPLVKSTLLRKAATEEQSG